MPNLKNIQKPNSFLTLPLFLFLPNFTTLYNNAVNNSIAKNPSRIQSSSGPAPHKLKKTKEEDIDININIFVTPGCNCNGCNNPPDEDVNNDPDYQEIIDSIKDDIENGKYNADIPDDYYDLPTLPPTNDVPISPEEPPITGDIPDVDISDAGTEPNSSIDIPDHDIDGGSSSDNGNETSGGGSDDNSDEFDID